MTTNFLQYSGGTGGFLTSPINLFTTELNALGSGNTVTSSVGGTSGVFTQSSVGSGIWGKVFFKSGGAFTPTGSPFLSIWWLESEDAGSNFATAITANADMPLPADVVIPLYAAAYASGNRAWASGLILLPFTSHKAFIRNSSGVGLPATNNIIQFGSVAVQY